MRGTARKMAAGHEYNYVVTIPRPERHRHEALRVDSGGTVRGENPRLISYFGGGPYRARTDDIHGVNVALYQLS